MPKIPDKVNPNYNNYNGGVSNNGTVLGYPNLADAYKKLFGVYTTDSKKSEEQKKESKKVSSNTEIDVDAEIKGNSLVDEVCKILQERPITFWNKREIKDGENLNTVFYHPEEKFEIAYNCGEKTEEGILITSAINTWVTGYAGYSGFSSSSGVSSSNISRAWVEGFRELYNSEDELLRLARFIEAQFSRAKDLAAQKVMDDQLELAEKVFGTSVSVKKVETKEPPLYTLKIDPSNQVFVAPTFKQEYLGSPVGNISISNGNLSGSSISNMMIDEYSIDNTVGEFSKITAINSAK